MQPTLPHRMSRPTALANMADGEDEECIAAHITGMCKELRKPSPSHEYLCDSMRRTFAERRGWIAFRIPSVKDVLEKYPALSTSAIVHLEFQVARNVQLLEALEKVFQNSASKIVAAVRKKRHLDSLNKDIVGHVDSASEPSQSDDVMLTAAVCVLPSLVKERMEAFICPDISILLKQNFIGNSTNPLIWSTSKNFEPATIMHNRIVGAPAMWLKYLQNLLVLIYYCN
nr:uncharacterized protein LOC129382446 [Dermacentor andersoni]